MIFWLTVVDHCVLVQWITSAVSTLLLASLFPLLRDSEMQMESPSVPSFRSCLPSVGRIHALLTHVLFPALLYDKCALSIHDIFSCCSIRPVIKSAVPRSLYSSDTAEMSFLSDRTTDS